MTQKKNMNIRFCLTQFLYWATLCATQTFAATFFLGIGMSEQSVGILLATANIVGACCQMPVAHLCLKFAHDKLHVAGLFFSVLSMAALLAMYFASESVPVLYLTYSLTTISLNILLSILNLLGMQYSAEGYYLNFGLGRGIGSAGYAVACLVMGYAVAAVGISRIPLMALGTFGVFAVFLMTLPGVECREAKQENRKTGTAALKQIDCKFLLVLCTCLLVFTCFNAYNTYLIRIVQSFGGEVDDMGISAALAALLEVPTMILLSRIKKRFSTINLLCFSSLFLILKMGSILVLRNMGGVILAQCLQPLSYALFIPCSVFFVDEFLDRDKRAAGQFIMVQTNIVASILGSIIGGTIIEHFDTMTMVAVLTGLAAVGFVLMQLVKKIYGMGATSSADSNISG